MEYAISVGGYSWLLIPQMFIFIFSTYQKFTFCLNTNKSSKTSEIFTLSQMLCATQYGVILMHTERWLDHD